MPIFFDFFLLLFSFSRYDCALESKVRRTFSFFLFWIFFNEFLAGRSEMMKIFARRKVDTSNRFLGFNFCTHAWWMEIGYFGQIFEI